MSILDCALTTDEHGIVMLQGGPSLQEANLLIRSKEDALLADEKTSLCVTAVAVCWGLSKVSNLMFCDGRSTCSML